MPLRIVVRKSTGALTIDGLVNGKRYQRRASTNDPRLADEEAAAWEAEILRTAWHGERRGTRSFAEAALSYLEAEPRSWGQKAVIGRLNEVIGARALSEINQETVIELKRKLLRPDAAPGTYTRTVIMPVRAIMNYAYKLGWCDMPHLVAPKERPGRVNFLLPDEAEQLIVEAAPHLKPLLIFLIGTGARMSEALELEWRDVDLQGARAIFWKTKGGSRRVAHLPPVVVAALADLPIRLGGQNDRETDQEFPHTHVNGNCRYGRVFLWHDRKSVAHEYVDRERRYGGQIKTGWAHAIKRAGLNPDLTPHDCRHTWASWHYALHRDLIRLQQEGGWSTITLVTRYAHLLPQGHERAIRNFLGLDKHEENAVSSIPNLSGRSVYAA